MIGGCLRQCDSVLKVINPSNAETAFLKHKDAKFLENHLNPVMLVFIG